MSRYRKEMKIDVQIQFEMLQNIISYLFTDSPLINRKALVNIRDLFSVINTDQYENDEAMMARFFFINKVLEGKIEEGLFNYAMLIERCKGGIHDEEIETIIEYLDTTPELIAEEVKSVNQWISERLQNIHLFKHKDRIMDAFESLQIGDYESISDINEEVEEACGELLSDIRKAKADQLDNYDFDLTDESFDNAIEAAVIDLSRPSNYLKTGIQYLNEMYCGGYEAGRFYCYVGPSGGGKSVILLHSAIWGKAFNAETIQLSDPNKQPCIIFLSMENSIKETIERIWNMKFNTDIRKTDPKAVATALKSKGFCMDENGINIKIMYRPNKSISTDDLYSIIDEVQEDGYEVVMLVLDYIKRIRPAQMTKDLRLDLGNVVDELCTVAKLKNIPVVSATQMNREAIKIIEAAKESGKQDIAKALGASHVGESWQIIENSDYVTAIYKEYKPSNNTMYMCFHSLKTRAKKPTITYFAHPFEEGNEMHLLEDIDLKEPLSVKSIAEQLATTDNIGNRGRQSVRANRNATVSLRKAVSDNNDMEGL